MENSIYKSLIAKNFSRYALTYDRYADIQRAIGDLLIEELESINAADILEVGCGTGYYTSLLAGRFRDARIEALDLSEPMVNLARKRLSERAVEFTVCDAEQLDAEDKYDLITSNAVFQWFERLEGVMPAFKNALRRKGAIAFSVFGPSTFRELKYSLKMILGQNIPFGSSSFPAKAELEESLGRHFVNFAVKEVFITEGHQFLIDLLRKIKYTGTGGNRMEKGFVWGKGLLTSTEEIYRKTFGNIEASYQVFFCKAVK